MSDVVTLGIGVDLSELEKATKALEVFEKKAKKAEDAAKKIGLAGKAADGAGQAFDKYGRGAGDAAAATDKLGQSAQKAGGYLGFMQKALLGFLSVQTVQMLTGMADRMQTLNNQIKLVTGSESAALSVRKELLEISNRTYASLEATGSLYVKSSRALEAYGYSQQKVLKFVEATNNAMRVGGVGAQEQAAAIFQLSQALGSGRLQGDEFRTIAEAAPIMLDILAQHLGKTRAEIRALASEGKLTSEVMVEAMTGAGAMLEQQAEKMSVTLGGALTVLKNNFAELVNETLNSSGAMSGVAKVVQLLADNLQTVAQVIGVLGFAYLLQMLSTATVAVGGLGTAFKRLAVAMMANPFVAAAAAIVGLLAATGELNNAMDALGIISRDVLDLIITGYKGLADLVSAVYSDLTSSAEDYTQQSAGFFDDFFSDVGDGFWGFLEGVGKVFDAMAALISSAVEWGVDAFMDLWTAVQNGAIGAASAAIGAVEQLVNSVISGINQVIALANQVPGVNIGTVGAVGLTRIGGGNAPLVGRNFADIYNDQAARQQSGGLQNYFRNARGRADGGGAAFGRGNANPASRAGGGGGGKRGGGGGGKSEADRVIEQFNRELANVQDKLAGVKAEFADIDQYGFKNQFTALRDFNQELEKTNGRYSKFNEQQRAAIRYVIEQIHGQEQLNALQSFQLDNKRSMEDMAFEIGLIGESAAAVERLRFERDLDKKAKEISAGMSEKYINQVHGEVAGIKQQREELERLKKQRQEVYGNDWVGGIEDGARRFIDSAGTMRDQFANMTQSTIQTLTDGLGTLAATGKLNFRDMTVSILQDLSKIFMRMAVMRLVDSLFPLGPGWKSAAGGYSSLFSGVPYAQANGGAWQNGVQFFADGGVFTNRVVNWPTMFAHGGGFGVMGEAGPEAIMPLTRGPNGKLGVMAHGTGGGVQNNITITVNVDSNGQTEESAQSDSTTGRGLAELIKATVMEVIVREQSYGGLLHG